LELISNGISNGYSSAPCGDVLQNFAISQVL